MADNSLEKLGKYQLHQKVGRGGMSDVYRATDTDTGLTVALKLFRTSDAHDAEVARLRCEHEMSTSQAVDHPNIVKVFESGEVDNRHYFTMEFIKGESLGRRVRTGEPLTLDEKLEMLMQTALGLGLAHRNNIVHRDIKPGNIMLTYDAEGHLMVKITDFGIAADVTDSDLSGRRQVSGTPKYLAPEVIRGTGIDGRSDIFALGVTAYELFTGADPFEPDEETGYLKANIEQHPRAMSSVVDAIAPELDLLVAKMLAKDPDDRYDAASLARDIARVQTSLASGQYPVEYEDAESAFFVGQEEAGERPDPVARALLVGGLVAGGLVVAILALILLLLVHRGKSRKPKPGIPAASAVHRPTTPAGDKRLDEPPDATTLAMQTADLLVADGKLEEAKAIFERLLSQVEGSAVQSDLRARIRQIDDKFAQQLYSAAAAAFDGQDYAKCRGMLSQLQQSYPRWKFKADALAAKIKGIEAKERESKAQKARAAPLELESLRAEAEYILSFKKDYRKVIDKYQAFAKQFAGTPEASVAQKEILSIAGRWQKSLTGNTELTERDVSAYVKARQAYRRAKVEKVMIAGEPAILLALAKAHRTRGDSAAEAAVLDRLIKTYPNSPQAASAKQAGSTPSDQSGGDLSLGTQLVERFSRGLATQKAWTRLGAHPDVSISFAEGEMVIAGEYADGKASASGLQTTRFSARALEAGVSFRVPFAKRQAPAAAMLVVFELSNESGEAFRVYFDGERYGMGSTKQARGESRAIEYPAAQAKGDEDKRPHELRLTYDPKNAKVVGFVDQLEIGSRRLRAKNLRLSFFVFVVDKTAFHVRFQEFRCKFVP